MFPGHSDQLICSMGTQKSMLQAQIVDTGSVCNQNWRGSKAAWVHIDCVWEKFHNPAL